MKKTKRQKAFESKHLMANRVLSMPYMRRSIGIKKIRSKRLHPLALKNAVDHIMREREIHPLFKFDNGTTFHEGVSVHFPGKIIRFSYFTTGN